MSSERRLAAIMFCDIVGYTAMMEQDEGMARGNVEHFKNVLEETLDAHNGEVQHYYGDGCLCLFNAATDAVRCAFEMQKEFQQTPTVPLRIGIHLGEVLIDKGEIYGSGVNLASRIESIGKAGTVLFSKTIFEQIQNHPEFSSVSLGSFEFKNVDRSTEVFALSNKGIPVPDADLEAGKLKEIGSNTGNSKRNFIIGSFIAAVMLASYGIWTSSQNNVVERSTVTPKVLAKTIAVLPFDNFSSEEEHEFFAQAMADEIRARLLNIKDLKVISRASSDHFKGKNMSAQQIGKNLDVNYLLGGRVQRAENSVKISVELSNTRTNELEWSPPPFERSLEDIFLIETEIADQIVDLLSVQLTALERSAFDKAPTENTEAYEAFLTAQELLHRGGGRIDELNASVIYFKKALSLDPEFDRAYLGLARAHIEFLFWGRKKPIEAMNDAMDAAFNAKNTESAEYLATIGTINFFRFEGDIARKHLEKAVEMSPNYTNALVQLAWLDFATGHYERSEKLMEQAHILDPISTFYSGSLGLIYYYAKQYDKGIDRMSELLSEQPDDDFLKWMLGYLYSGKGDNEKAVEIFQSRKAGQKTNWMLGYALGRIGEKDKAQDVLDYLLAKREDSFVPAFMIAAVYMGNGDHEKAIEWLEQDIADGGQGHFIWGLTTDPIFDPIREDERFIAILSIIK